MKEADLKSLPPLSLPYAPLKIAKTDSGDLKVFDKLRKKYVSLTPEEFVRQNFVHWLMESYGYPASLLQNEVAIDVNGSNKRCDTIAFGRAGEPLVIVEYKAPDVEITQNVFDQIYRYNLSLKAKYLIVSNGIKNYCCVIDYRNQTYNFIPVIPSYRDAVGMPGVN